MGNQEIKISSVSFDDVDLLAEWTHELGWDNKATQLTCGANEIRYDHFVFPDLVVAHFRAQQSMHNLFALPDGMALFLICRKKLPLVWCGRQVPPKVMGVARSGREHDVVIQPGWNCYEFMVSEDLIRRTELFAPRFFVETAKFEHAWLPLMEPITGRFLQRMDSYFRSARHANGSLGAAARTHQFFDFIIDGLQQVIEAGLTARGSFRPSPIRRPDLVMKGRDFVSVHLTESLSAHDMAQALGVSYRVLNYAFKDTLGVSPYQYILTQKLHATRRQLRSSGRSVSDVCASYRFGTPSRFSRQYSRLFGELPSETRSSNRRRRG